MRSLRLVVTAEDYDEAVRFYRDVLGMPEQMASADAADRFVILGAGMTIEIGDPAHAARIDHLEVGRRVAGPVRVAFEVSDAGSTTELAIGGGAVLVAPPTVTPWGSVNSRVDTPGGLHVTFFSQDTTLEGQRELNGPVELVEPDPAWSTIGSGLVQEVRTALGVRALLMEHVGSTAVQDLPAKPVIDLLLTVTDPAAEDEYVPDLVALGYRLHRREPEWYEHRLLRRAEPAVNLHVFGPTSPEVARMVGFRDHLRGSPEDRELYARTKRDLAARTWRVVQDYADAKTAVVHAIGERANSSAHQP